MLTITKPASLVQEVKRIHVRLLDNYFHENTDTQIQTLSAATGMTHAPFSDFFNTMVAKNKGFAMNSPLYQAFRHCFPDKQVLIDDSEPFDKVQVITVPVSKKEAQAIVSELIERTNDDYEKHCEVRAIANVLESASAETYVPWIRLARIAAVGDALDQRHVSNY